MITSGYYGTERVDVNCTQTLSNFTGIITVLRTVGAAYSSQFHTFWSGTMQQSYVTSSSQIQYIWTIISGQTIAGSGFPYYFEAQFQLQGTNQTVANDTFSIVTRSACNGQLLTFSGHFWFDATRHFDQSNQQNTFFVVNQRSAIWLSSPWINRFPAFFQRRTIVYLLLFLNRSNDTF